MDLWTQWGKEGGTDRESSIDIHTPSQVKYTACGGATREDRELSLVPCEGLEGRGGGKGGRLKTEGTYVQFC